MKNKRIIILILVLSILLIPTCYAILKTDINMVGSARIIGLWDVRITDIKLTNICEDCLSKEPTYANATCAFDVGLVKPGDSITYEITITNEGNVDAVFDKTTINIPKENEFLKIITSPPLDILPAKASTIVYITIYYDENITAIPTITETNFTCNIRYIQKTD